MPRKKSASKSDSIMTRPEGMIDEGTLDLSHRPHVKNSDGSTSTVRSMSFRDAAGERLVPTVREDGWYMSPKEAVEHYKKTGRHMGVFDTPENATAYSKKISKFMK